jgi:chromosome segregation ATPase
MGFSTPSEPLDTVVTDDVFRNAVETLKTYVESAESKLLHAERQTSEYKSKLDIAERHGWESERRRQEAEKQSEELERKRREENNEQTELKAKLAAIAAQLQNVAGGS